ncbi:FAD-dependent oxidoreductase [Agaribacterium haliotis]|uniref:FAD-dependent oxidoreductase n=1 Tax=Agaribacterium haliotis TaxID=2013869 RepID=UPI000BB574CA|nr:FAD-dependent oxidoreductase [Agaribacterium haliotis]
MSSSDEYDVAIIGAGIQGLGLAQACSLQGWKVAVVEKMPEPLTQTSSRSTKLIHGGLRYLEQGKFALVRQCLKERRLLCKLAPDLVRLQPFYLPVYKHSVRSFWCIALGLLCYWALAGFCRDGAFSVFWGKRAQKKASEAGLNCDRLSALFIYNDAQTDDRALGLAVLKSAKALGAKLFFCTEVDRICKTEQGFELRGSAFNMRSRVVINAAGPWVDRVHGALQPLPKALNISKLAGSHVLFSLKADYRHCYLESPEDGRPVFVLPWQGKLLIGTTEKQLQDDGELETLACSEQELHYLIAVHNYYFPARSLSADELVASFCGSRVLAACKEKMHAAGREHVVWHESDFGAYWAICGGKLTTYRLYAEQLLPALARALGYKASLRSTRTLFLQK